MPEKKYILALDQGTTSCRAIIFNNNAQVVASEQREFTQFYPQPGWVEQDADELFLCQLTVMKDVVRTAKILPGQIEAVGITNQRETIVVWDKKTGKPVYHAIVWQCRRTASVIDDLIRNNCAEMIHAKTGLLPDPYFSGTKISWILDHVPGARQQAEDGKLLCGTIDSFLIWKLTGGLHITDYTNASRTMLFNIHTLSWDKELLALLRIPESILPTVKDSSAIYGITDTRVCGFEIPVAAAIGDQQSALFGQGCFNPGEVKNTYGTGCFMLMNTGTTPVDSQNKLLTTIAFGMNNSVEYALEGSVFMGGATIKWLRDELGLIKSANQCDILAESVSSSNGCVIVPAFTGLGSPYWDPYARGIIAGLTRGVTKAHICRAVLESIAFQVKDILDCMSKDAGYRISQLKVDGGASKSNVMLQFQSDILDIPVFRPNNVETTAMGCAFLAGLATGVWNSKEEILAHWKIDHIFMSQMNEKDRTSCYSIWKKAVKRSMNWENT